MRRFRVAEKSMLPGLGPGDEVVATDSRRSEPGELVVFELPGRPDFWLIKRRVEPPKPIGRGRAWVISDNDTETTIDSRTFGSLAADDLLPVVDRLDSATFVEACQLLVAEDESLAALVSTHGIPPLWSRPPGFATLVLLILEQQVSLESGAAMFRRVRKAAGEVVPEAILDLGAEKLRKLGITRQKAGYITDLARAIRGGALDLESIWNLQPARAKAALMEIRGIGAWTSDAYILSALRHIDVFPEGDRALQLAVGDALKMSSPPSPGQLELIAEPWRPVRAAAARLLWHGYLSARGRSEPGDDLLHVD